MSFRINTNIASLQSQEYLRNTSESQSKTIGRVTSGLRILSSGDDAAGLSIANSFRSDQAVLQQGIRNANDGLSTLQTIDGGINNISKLLDRARTLATQSASGTFIGSRAVLNSEFGSVINEIDRQAQAIGLNAGGEFAKALSVFIGGGKSSGGITAIQNGASQVDLSNSTVDAKSLGLKGAQAQGIPATDIGTGSASTSVSAIVNDPTNSGSLAAAGFTDFYFRGPGFGDSKRIKVAVNLSGVTNVDNLVTAVNHAIASAGTVVSPEATAFQNANIGASVVTAADGKKSIAFSSSSTAFQVEAGDQLSNALLGNVTSASNPTGKTLINTVTGGSSTAATATTFGASGAGTVQVRFQGAGLSSPIDISLTVGAGTTVDQALANLTSQVTANSSLQAAGITVTTAAAGSPLVFTSARGERFEVGASGDLNGLLGLGSYRSSGGASGTFDYSTLTGSGGSFAASAETLEFSIGGGAAVSTTITPAAATITPSSPPTPPSPPPVSLLPTTAPTSPSPVPTAVSSASTPSAPPTSSDSTQPPPPASPISPKSRPEIPTSTPSIPAASNSRPSSPSPVSAAAATIKPSPSPPTMPQASAIPPPSCSATTPASATPARSTKPSTPSTRY